jgi:16S rRNA (cytosine1402-N4)-methyltransferase
VGGVHTPVMVGPVLQWLGVRPGGVYVDGTLGGGGHAATILRALNGQGRLIGIDRDRAALERASECLAEWKENARLVCGNFSDMLRILENEGVREADGILLDLGLSSDQLADPKRGFSFMENGPLDMRMDLTNSFTAADLVASLDENELADVLYRFGEEPEARRIARALVEERDKRLITTTRQLVEIVERAKRRRSRSLHPATQTFQALRIAVNRELESLQSGLEAGLSLLKPGGRMVVISFHSLEDRIVKQTFAAHAGRWKSLPQGGRAWEGAQPAVRVLTRKPVRATPEEVAQNPRARSARLRAVERN